MSRTMLGAIICEGVVSPLWLVAVAALVWLLAVCMVVLGEAALFDVPATPEFDLTMMSANWLTSVRRPMVLMVSWNCCSGGAGCWPICPAAT